MITFTRTMIALPGKFHDVIAYLKENQAFVKDVVGLDSSINAVSGGTVGEFVSILAFTDFAHYEDVVTKLFANPGYATLLKKSETLIVPGSAHDQLLRSI